MLDVNVHALLDIAGMTAAIADRLADNTPSILLNASASQTETVAYVAAHAIADWLVSYHYIVPHEPSGGAPPERA